MIERRTTMALLIALVLSVAACSSGGGGGEEGAGGDLAAGPPEEASVPAGTWAGRLDDTDAFVAVVTGDDEVVAYVCEDGKVSSWFFGGAPSAEMQLENAAGHRLEVTLADEATGIFDDGDSAHTFAAAATDDEVLFRADALVDGDPVVGGWIRIGDETRGSLTLASGIQPAPVLTPGADIQLSPEALAALTPAPMTPDTLVAPTANTTKFVWAAGGDSFASGEGNPERGISKPSETENFAGLRWSDDASITIPIPGRTLAADVTTCHRSDEAGAPKAQRQLQALYTGVQFALGFVACGGGQTVDMVQDGYTGPNSTTQSLIGNARVPQPAQLNRIQGFRNAQGRLDALYMSVGGNDMGFGPMIESCIDPLQVVGDCVEEADAQLTERAAAVEAGYDAIEARIVQLFGNGLPVLVSHYPNPVHDQVEIESPPVCLGSDYERHGEVGVGGFDDILKNNITADEAIFAFGISARINVAVSAAATKNGWTIVNGHVGASQRHGLCTDDPFFNLNSAALRRQGRDIPNTAIFFFSGGLLHPNNAGFTRYGEAITASLRPFVDNVVRTGLAAPTNVRIAAATNGGALTVHWNDRATAENAFDVEVLPARSQDATRINRPSGATQLSGGGFVVRVAGSGVQEFVHQASGAGQFKYRVRACHTAITAGEKCGPYSAQITGFNTNPAQVSGITVRASARIVNNRPQPTVTVSWTAQADALEYVVRVEPTSGGTPVDVRTTSTSVTQNGLLAGMRFKVAACNRVGCSTFRSAG